jgi:hypothetical protein
VPHGPGWEMFGDSSHLKDPVAGIGITDSFRSAETMAAALDSWFTGQAAEDEAFAGYRAWRDETFTEAFGQHLRAAQLRPFPPDVLTVVEACKHNDDNRVGFFRLLGALTPMREFFTPENCLRILADAEAATGRPWRLRGDPADILNPPPPAAAHAAAAAGS